MGVYAYTDTFQTTTARITSSTTASTVSSSITTNMGFTATTFANSSYPTTVTTTNTNIGLNFTLTLGSSELITGQNLSITASVTNERSTFNNLTSESDWSEPWLIGWGAIDSCNSFANAQVFQGYYDQSNRSSLQSGTELQLAKPLFPPMECPFIPGAWSTYFPFEPHESRVGYQYSTTGDYGNASSASSSPNSTFHLFDSGVYTVAAGDEWGQLVLLHFTVSDNSVQTSSSSTISTNVFFSTTCVISSVGGFEFRVVSDSMGSPVNASSISAVDRVGCNNENQVVYLTQFSYSGDGWIVPIFPSQATVGGGLNITVTYEGKTYNFVGYYPSVGTDCVTLSIPSGNVSSTTVMNGNGSYCSATATSSVSYSSTSSSSFSSSSNNSNNKLGLELFASVNSTELTQEDSSLLLNITVIDTLPTQNNVSYANSWAIANMSHLGEPCNFYSPTGFAVFSGYYSLNNLSQGTPLNLYPIEPMCPAAFIFNGSSIIGVLQNVTSYSFLPKSDRANYSGYYIPESSTNGSIFFGMFPTTLSHDQSIFTTNSTEPTISYSPSASSTEYTLAVGDEWGDLLLIHFTVSGCGPFGCDESTTTVSSGETP